MEGPLRSSKFKRFAKSFSSWYARRMNWTHAPLQDERLDSALAKGLPFVRTLCGSAAALSQVVPSELATCPSCRGVVAKRRESLSTVPPVPLGPPPGVDLDAFFDASLDLPPASPTSSSAPAEVDPFSVMEAKMAEAKAMLDWVLPLLTGMFPVQIHPDALVFFDPSKSDAQGFRRGLSSEDLAVLQAWFEASSSMGLEPLWKIVGSMLARHAETLRAPSVRP